jgi:hypothetical protein
MWCAGYLRRLAERAVCIAAEVLTPCAAVMSAGIDTAAHRIKLVSLQSRSGSLDERALSSVLQPNCPTVDRVRATRWLS